MAGGSGTGWWQGVAAYKEGARQILPNLVTSRTAAGVLLPAEPCSALRIARGAKGGLKGVEALPALVCRNFRQNGVRGASGRQEVAAEGSGNLRQKREAPEIRAPQNYSTCKSPDCGPMRKSGISGPRHELMGGGRARISGGAFPGAPIARFTGGSRRRRGLGIDHPRRRTGA